MPANRSHASHFMSTHLKEAIKQYFEYDGQNRMIRVYTAGSDVGEGGHCVLTEYTYLGSTNKVEKMKESRSTWDSEWDL